MPSATGHAKNVANFKTLRTYVETLGAKYNPPKEMLKVGHLKSIEAEAEKVLGEVESAKLTLSLAVDKQNEAFELLDDHVIRVVNLQKALIDDQDQIEAAVNLKNLIKGTNKKASAEAPKTEVGVDVAESPAPNEPRDRKVTQRSYDKRVENFGALIKLVGSNPQYAPLEEDLNIAGLTQLHATIKQQTEAVDSAEAAVVNGRSRRTEVMYAENKGLVDIAKGVKNYVKAVLGLGSPEVEYLNGLSFTSF